MSGPIDLEVELAGIVDSLGECQIPYALCGGLALAVHGFPRATKDIDFLVEPSAIEAALDAVRPAGFTLRAGPIPLGLNTAHPQRLFRATKVVEGNHLTVDLLEVSKSYEVAWKSREIAPWKGRNLSVVSRAGLVSMKSFSTRLKDQADVATLKGLSDE